MAIKSLKKFCALVTNVFEKQYLWSPLSDDLKRLLEKVEERGFLGML